MASFLFKWYADAAFIDNSSSLRIHTPKLHQPPLDGRTSFALGLNGCAIADDLARDHPAGEVYVTGTFDDWAKSVKLEKKGEGFEKLVDLPPSEDKILYKVRKFLRSVWQEMFS